MGFLFLRYDNGIFQSTMKKNEFLKLARKLQLIGNEVYFYGVQDYSENASTIKDECGWVTCGERTINNDEELQVFFNEGLSNPYFSVLLVSFKDIELIRRNYEITSELPEFDCLVFDWVNDKWQEIPHELFESMFNQDLSAHENVINTIRATVYPQIAAVENTFSEMSSDNKTSLRSAKDTFRRTTKKIDSLASKAHENANPDLELNKKLEEISNDLEKLNNDVEMFTDKGNEIIKNMQQDKITMDFDSSKVIKYATNFNMQQITLVEKQSQGNDYHLLTVTNNTSYHWENLVIYIKESQKRLQEIPNLKPYETLNLEADYEFELLNEFGCFSMQVYFGDHQVSEEILICRILLLELKKSGNIHEIVTKNQYIAMQGCSIWYKVNGNEEKVIAASFSNFGTKKIAIRDLRHGDQVEFVVYNDKVNLSELKKFTVD
jgi:hypothetical protein